MFHCKGLSIQGRAFQLDTLSKAYCIRGQLYDSSCKWIKLDHMSGGTLSIGRTWWCFGTKRERWVMRVDRFESPLSACASRWEQSGVSCSIRGECISIRMRFDALTTHVVVPQDSMHFTLVCLNPFHLFPIYLRNHWSFIQGRVVGKNDKRGRSWWERWLSRPGNASHWRAYTGRSISRGRQLEEEFPEFNAFRVFNLTLPVLYPMLPMMWQSLCGALTMRDGRRFLGAAMMLQHPPTKITKNTSRDPGRSCKVIKIRFEKLWANQSSAAETQCKET